MNSGYKHERANLHDWLLPVVADQLKRRGIPSELLTVNDHDPDGRFVDGTGYWDLKTGSPNITIEDRSLNAYKAIEHAFGVPVYIIHATNSRPETWTVDRVASLECRRIGSTNGYRNSGNGSNDRGFVFRRGGTPFDESFPLGVVA